MTGFSALPGGSASTSSGAVWSGASRIKGPSWARMPLLTIGMLGLQIVWSVEMGYASPYLLSLGLSKSFVSVVFVAGPLSGLIVQPLIGVLADHSRSRFGRRRPYMLGGSLICVGGIILLGFTRWFSSIFVSEGTSANDILTIAFAVWSICCIDFSINAVQTADRAILVDVLPPEEQEVGNAWAGRMFGLGSVAGFFVGNVDLPKAFPWLGRTELQVLSILTGLFLMITQGITSAAVTEKVLVREAEGEARGNLIGIVKDIWNNFLALPRVILQICIVQFFSWIAWFPVLFFSTVWIGEIYTRQALAADPSLDPSDPFLQAEATRAGSRALLWSSILSLAASVILPFLVHQSADRSNALEKDWHINRGVKAEQWAKVLEVFKGMRFHLATLWMASHLIFAITMGLTYFATSVENASALITITGFSWAVSQWVPFSLLGEAILSPDTRVYDPNDDTPIPLSDHRTHRPSSSISHSRHTSAAERQQLISAAQRQDGESRRAGAPRSPLGMNRQASVSGIEVNLLPLRNRLSTETLTESERASALERGKDEDPIHPSDEEEEELDDLDDFAGVDADGSGTSNKAGIILGIHNIFVVIPQFLVTGLSSILFAILEPDKSVLHQGHGGHPTAGGVPVKNATHVVAPPDVRSLLVREVSVEGPRDSIGLIFRIGGVSAAIACVLCWRLSRELLAKGR